MCNVIPVLANDVKNSNALQNNRSGISITFMVPVQEMNVHSRYLESSSFSSIH